MKLRCADEALTKREDERMPGADMQETREQESKDGLSFLGE